MISKQNTLWLLTLCIFTTIAFVLGENQESEVVQLVSPIVVKQVDVTLDNEGTDWVDVYDKKDQSISVIDDLKKRLSKSATLIKMLSKANSEKGSLLSTDSLSSPEKISQVVEQADDEEINFYLDQYFPEEILGRIDNKRGFSKRLLEEFATPAEPENKAIHGELSFSLTKIFPQQPVANFNPKRWQEMVAFIKTDGSLEPTDQVFIRWVRASDNKVLLFKNVLIRESSNINWVTLKPKFGWKEGSYVVTIYTFQDSLNVIAQGVYDVDYVE